MIDDRSIPPPQNEQGKLRPKVRKQKQSTALTLIASLRTLTNTISDAHTQALVGFLTTALEQELQGRSDLAVLEILSAFDLIASNQKRS